MSLRARLISLAIAIVTAIGLVWVAGLVSPPIRGLFHVDTSQIDNVPVRGGDFELADSHGPWRLTDHTRGKTLVLLYFGFTRCPDLCPTTLAALSHAIQSLPDAERQRVMVVFVSVDWRSDTPARTDAYARYFGPEFVGLCGTRKQIDEVAAQFSTAYSFTEEPGSAMKYTVNHPGVVYLLSFMGAVEDELLPDKGVPDLVARLRKYL